MTVGSRSSSCVERGQPPPCRRGEARSHKVRCVGSGSARAPRQSPGAAPPTSASAPRPCSPQAPWPPSRMSVLRVAAPRQASQHKVSSHPEGRRRSPRRSRAGGDQRGRGARQRALGRRAGRTARGGARARGGGLGGTPEASRAAARRRAPRRHRSGGVHHHELRSPRKLVALYRQKRARERAPLHASASWEAGSRIAPRTQHGHHRNAPRSLSRGVAITRPCGVAAPPGLLG
jgi:hypothetical protein